MYSAVVDLGWVVSVSLHVVAFALLLLPRCCHCLTQDNERMSLFLPFRFLVAKVGVSCFLGSFFVYFGKEGKE